MCLQLLGTIFRSVYAALVTISSSWSELHCGDKALVLFCFSRLYCSILSGQYQLQWNHSDNIIVGFKYIKYKYFLHFFVTMMFYNVVLIKAVFQTECSKFEVHGDCFNVMLFISIIHWYLLYCTNWIGAQKHNNIDKKWLQFGACVNSLKRPLRPHPSLVGAVNITSHFVKLGRLCAHALFYKTRHYAPAVSCTHPFICRLFQRAFVSASLLFKGRQGKREELSSLQVNECERVGVCPDWMVHYLTMENWSLSVSKCPAPRVGFSPFPFFTSSSSPIICLTGPHYGGKGIYKYI